jgi:hypothetical protein
MKATEARDRLNLTDAYSATIQDGLLRITLLKTTVKHAVKLAGGATWVQQQHSITLPIAADHTVDAGYISYLTAAAD